MDLHLVVLLLCLICVWAKDYYEILGVKRDATEKEIKKKFRELGKRENDDRSFERGVSP